MSGMRAIEPITLAEFEAMEKSEGFDYELIDGVVMMSPRPAKLHQRISGRLYATVFGKLNGKNCEPLQDVDLVLDDNHLIPDLMVVCDDKFEGGRQETAPLIVIEILSPSSMNRDHFTKRIKYEQLGIQEYWIVSPEDKCVMVISYTTGAQNMYCDGVVKSAVIPELEIELNKIFPE